MSSPETVVIALNWVGDNILALPTFRALQHRFRGEGGIAVAAPENVAPLLASSGIFRKVISWNGSTRSRIESLRRGGKFRRAVILPDARLAPNRETHRPGKPSGPLTPMGLPKGVRS